MTSGNSEQQSSLDKARSYLERAERAIDTGYQDAAGSLAAIGTGFAVLAQVEALGPVPTVITGFGSGVDAAAVRRGIQAAEEARPHDGEPVRCGFEGCESRALSSGRCGLLAHAVPPSECGCGGPLAHDSLDPRCAYFAGREADRG